VLESFAQPSGILDSLDGAVLLLRMLSESPAVMPSRRLRSDRPERTVSPATFSRANDVDGKALGVRGHCPYQLRALRTFSITVGDKAANGNCTPQASQRTCLCELAVEEDELSRWAKLRGRVEWLLFAAGTPEAEADDGVTDVDAARDWVMEGTLSELASAGLGRCLFRGSIMSGGRGGGRNP
jgi:hypothetical protein